jgi:hypothetical protein
MGNPVLFVHGGGEGAYEEDAKLAASLRDRLGAGHVVRYPEMPNEADADYEVWKNVIAGELAAMGRHPRRPLDRRVGRHPGRRRRRHRAIARRRVSPGGAVLAR